MLSNIIGQGAEAVLTKNNSTVVKDRVAKGYRLPQLDESIRKLRTRHEGKILERAAKLIPVPKLITSDEREKKITMEYIAGKKLSEHLETLKNYKTICKQIGKSIAKLHDADIIHGDLTTSNMILKDKTVYFIDFGLAFHSPRAEAKAVDLHLIKQALEAKHPTIFEQAAKAVMQGYETSKNYKSVMTRLAKVEKRGRYKAQY